MKRPYTRGHGNCGNRRCNKFIADLQKHIQSLEEKNQEVCKQIADAKKEQQILIQKTDNFQQTFQICLTQEIQKLNSHFAEIKEESQVLNQKVENGKQEIYNQLSEAKTKQQDLAQQIGNSQQELQLYLENETQMLHGQLSEAKTERQDLAQQIGNSQQELQLYLEKSENEIKEIHNRLSSLKTDQQRRLIDLQQIISNRRDRKVKEVLGLFLIWMLINIILNVLANACPQLDSIARIIFSIGALIVLVGFSIRLGLDILN